MTLHRLLLGWLVFSSLASPAQTVQWAHKVLGKSSEYSEKRYGAQQVVGIPNVLPAFRESPCAWSPLTEQNRENEWIWVEFKRPMKIRQVAIAESFNPGATVEVILYDMEGKQHTVFEANAPEVLAVKGRMLRVNFPMTTYTVKSVKIVLNTLGWPGFKHIDAIGISDGTTPIEAEINLLKGLTFEGAPENLGPSVNSAYDEIMPIISPDGKTLYFDRKDHPDNTGELINDDIWVSTLSGSSWSAAHNVGQPLNNTGHNFLTAISPDGNTALLGNVYEPDGSMTSGLSLAERHHDSWSFPKKLVIKNYYNLNKFSEYHMGADGKTIVMTVERSDAQGSKDLYVSFAKPDGTWSEPVSLGPTVNSAATEMSPFLAADGKTLYFSSDGFSGYGGKDMYMTRRLDDSWTKWSQPCNLGSQINSAAWDAYYSVPASGEYAYFSSESRSLGKTDIYRIKLPKEMRPDPVVLVRGFVKDQKTGKPLRAKITIETLPDGKEVGVAVSNAKNGEFTIVLPAGKRYGFLAISEGYLSEGQNLDLSQIAEYKEVTQDLALVPIKVGESMVLNNIFFMPSSSKLSSDSKPELDRIAAFFREHPTAQVEIGGHTNNGCTEQYCIQLSTERAKSVYDYLIKAGIEPTRVKFKGYGSAQPRYSNTTAEGQRMNRRVEFKILSI